MPDRIFLGAAENGPAYWPGYRTVRAGPYNTVKFSRNLSAQTGGAKTQILRSDDEKNLSFLRNGLPRTCAHDLRFRPSSLDSTAMLATPMIDLCD
jgi:hypothetical protein